MKYCKFILALLVLAVLACGFLWRKPLKDDFLTMNGGFNRWVLAKKYCNRVYIIDDDMGYMPISGKFYTSPANQVVRVYNEAIRYSKKFLYVQGPDKVCFDRSNVDGIPFGGDTYDFCDDMLRTLKDANVPVVDLREAVCSTAESVRNNYMRTDTHWNYDGIFCAFQYLIPIICSQLGMKDVDCEGRLDKSAWVRRDFPRKVLGSVGRRCGPWFLLPEDFHYYVPDFKNTFTIRGKRPWEKQERKVKGDFEKVFVFKKVLDKPQSVYRDSAYDIIGGGNWDWLEVHNENAPCKARVMIVTDSYGRGLLAFLSTVISDLRLVDYRTYKGRSVKNEIKAYRPNLVVVFASCRVMQNLPFWNFYLERSYK